MTDEQLKQTAFMRGLYNVDGNKAEIEKLKAELEQKEQIINNLTNNLCEEEERANKLEEENREIKNISRFLSSLSSRVNAIEEQYVKLLGEEKVRAFATLLKERYSHAMVTVFRIGDSENHFFEQCINTALEEYLK